MAEDVVGGLIAGLEVEERETEAGLGGVDAAAMALAMDAARGDADLSRKAAHYFEGLRRLVDKQDALLGLQLQHFSEEQRAAVAAARRKGFSDRLRNGAQAFLVLVIAAVCLLGLAIIVAAAASRSVVVETFTTPPALAARGIVGQVVATKVLDRLQTLQGATRSDANGLKVQSAWSSDVKIEAPGTGVSIGEIDRVLRAQLGHDLHIGGDLIQTDSGGLALTVRGDGVPAMTFEGRAGDLDSLTGKAAEYVYGRSEPLQFATYLVGNGRGAEALAFLPLAYSRAADDETRARLENLWGNAYVSLNRPAEAAAHYRLAMALSPYNWRSWGNLVGALLSGGGEEAAWRESQALLEAARRAPKDRQPDVEFLGNVALVSRDLPMQLAVYKQDSSHNGGAGATLLIDGPAIARIYANMHDPVSTQRYLAMSDPDDSSTRTEALFLAGQAALEDNAAAGAVAPLEAFWKAWLADPRLQFVYPEDICLTGLAYGLVGRAAEAEAVFKRARPWSRCYAMHGEVLEHAGDLAGAERIWAEGLRVGPDLSPVYLQRGLSEMRRGDLGPAGADLAAASQRSPHWADPLKAWGDLLAREGRWREALAKYDAALQRAPAWTALRQARAAATREPSAQDAPKGA